MARKEQITITLDAELVSRLREAARSKQRSLSSVIEGYLLSCDAMTSSSDIQRVIKLVEEIKDQLVSKELAESLREENTPVRLPVITDQEQN